jgi:adenine-specific DNA-methyltransferase
MLLKQPVLTTGHLKGRHVRGADLPAAEPQGRAELVAASIALGATEFGGPLSAAERLLVERAANGHVEIDCLRDAIRAGLDPLGEAITRLGSPAERRRTGCFYTPGPIARAMAAWVLSRRPARLVDAGCGSGRFAAEAARLRPELQIIAIDRNPLATLACRAGLAVLGAKRARVVNADYTTFPLKPITGPTAFISNPPYVRHHDLWPEQKRHAKEMAARLGVQLSGLAGLHIHFLLTTLEHAIPGDVAAFITSAEWLDVRYGRALRAALAEHTRGLSIHLLDPKSVTFRDAMTTAVITCFEIGEAGPTVYLRAVKSTEQLGDLCSNGRAIPRSLAARSDRWSPLFDAGQQSPSRDLIRLGEIVRVSRGAVTGANRFFLLNPTDAERLGLRPYTVAALSAAREVLAAEGVVRLDERRRLLLDPPTNLDLSAAEHAALRRYLNLGERAGVPSGYICRHRKPWWRVGSKTPPAVATYMARQPPAFALNPDRLAIVNVLHGLYPRVDLDEEQLLGLVRYLSAHRGGLRGAGRTYQGGLEKFEPAEMEALLVPSPERLREYARQ